MKRSAPSRVSPLVLATAVVLLAPSDGAATDELSAHLRRELSSIAPNTPPSDVGYAVKRAWDLIVLRKIRFPGSSPDALSDKTTLGNLRSYCDTHPDLDPDVSGRMAALLGEYDTAGKWLARAAYLRHSQPMCGNAGEALKFGEEEFRLYLDFVQGRYAQVTQADIVSRRTNGIIGVNARSDRWCMLHGVTAAAHEALGDDTAALRFARQADSLTSVLQSSWNYYYPANHEMLAHIESTMRILAARIEVRSAGR